MELINDSAFCIVHVLYMYCEFCTICLTYKRFYPLHCRCAQRSLVCSSCRACACGTCIWHHMHFQYMFVVDFAACFSFAIIKLKKCCTTDKISVSFKFLKILIPNSRVISPIYLGLKYHEHYLQLRVVKQHF